MNREAAFLMQVDHANRLTLKTFCFKLSRTAVDANTEVENLSMIALIAHSLST